MFICHFCQRETASSNSNTNHELRCKHNPTRTIQGPPKGTPSKLKGVGRPERKGLKFGSSLTGHSTATKGKLSRIAIESGLGGRVEGSGRGKKGWYKGFFCDSSWELAYLVYQLDHSVKIERCKEVRFYEWEGKQRKYYPDFIVEDKIVEIKGYKTKQWEAKYSANSDVIVLYEKELRPYIKYVVDKYGKDFIKLYGSAIVSERDTVLKTV